MLDRRRPRPRRPCAPLPPARRGTSSSTRVAYETGVSRIRDYILAGDALQVVLSQRFTTPVDVSPFALYRGLRAVNPSPYMYFIAFDDFALAGSSPNRWSPCPATDVTRPIAGTRPRGVDAAGDRRLIAELQADQKECAEHIMLVDLGRNDLGSVCTPGSVRVDELMSMERYSHVIHMVSSVSGSLAPGLSALDALKGAFPAGTVSGAPKVRAMQIIDELETVRRGPYAGAIGYLSPDGDLDTCICIRTIMVKDGVAYVQAGAGIVADSDPSANTKRPQQSRRAAARHRPRPRGVRRTAGRLKAMAHVFISTTTTRSPSTWCNCASPGREVTVRATTR